MPIRPASVVVLRRPSSVVVVVVVRQLFTHFANFLRNCSVTFFSFYAYSFYMRSSISHKELGPIEML